LQPPFHPPQISHVAPSPPTGFAVQNRLMTLQELLDFHAACRIPH
jgi:hypothetical protein